MPSRAIVSVLAGTLLIVPILRAEVRQERSTPEQRLGERLFSEKNLSVNRNQACASCHSLEKVRFAGTHLPAPGFADPTNVATGSPVSEGSQPGAAGALNSPSAGYAAFSPFFHWDATEGLFVGGQFWNGRAATLAEQAEQPFLNPSEMAMPSRWAVVSRLKEKAVYVQAFRDVYGIDLDAIPAYEGAPPDMPAPPGVLEVYDRLTRAIAEFEKTPFFNRFTSKFDFFLAGKTGLTARERRGLELFSGKAQCSLCHPVEILTAPNGNSQPPLLTDFTYDNLGIPRNVNIPMNPEPDPGLGANPRVVATGVAAGELGKHKVMSLRNIAITPPYGHNGVFRTLEEIVHFYNTRDALPRVCRDNNDRGFGIDCWPAPEIEANVNTEELGNLGMTPEEERDLVAFLRTLTDGYRWPSPFADASFPPFP